MKSILTVLGTFIFSVFVEGFIRIIIIFYHQGEFQFFGISALPSISWVIIIMIAMLIITWLSGMLAITIADFSKEKHLLWLGIMIILWRLNEATQTYHSEPVWYLISIFLISLTGLILSYFTHKNVSKNSPS